jgi:hypothetical protein
MELYMDGKFCVDYHGSSGSLPDKSDDFSLGGWSGLISDLRVYSSPLDGGDISAMVNQTQGIYERTKVQPCSLPELMHKQLKLAHSMLITIPR